MGRKEVRMLCPNKANPLAFIRELDLGGEFCNGIFSRGEIGVLDRIGYFCQIIFAQSVQKP